LEQRVDDLLRVCDKLQEENDTLRGRREALLQEHTRLAEKNRLARSKLDNIIGRLKVIDGGA
jgi:cell division protein ZapB